MTLHRSGRHAARSALLCDGGRDQNDGCPRTFNGPNDAKVRVAWLRGRARSFGWLCNNPGPGKPARDLCPDHRGEAS